MGVTVDSSVLVDLLSGDRETVEVLEKLERGGHAPVLSTVAVFEVLSGVEFTNSRAERVRIEALLRRLPIDAFDVDQARAAAELRAELLRSGRSPGAPDVMIAGFALSEGHVLVTRDKRLATSATALGLEVVCY